MFRESDPPALAEKRCDAASSDVWRAALRARASAIERVPLGDRYVLHSPASGAILTTNDLGLAILSDPVRPPPRASCLPPAVIDEILQEWESSGLFNVAPQPFPAPVRDDGRQAKHDRHYASAWGGFSVETDNPVLAGELDELLWAFVPDGMPAPECARLRCVACPGGGLGVFRDGRPLWGRASMDVARYLIVREAAEGPCCKD